MNRYTYITLMDKLNGVDPTRREELLGGFLKIFCVLNTVD